MAALLEQGMEVPEDLEPPPEIWPVAQPYADAFDALSRSRGQGMSGVLPLEYTEITAYARDHGFAETDTERDEFVELIQAQDIAFRTAAREQNPQNTPSTPPSVTR